MREYYAYVLTAMTLPLMVFVVAPLTFYYGNLGEITFSLAEILFPVLAVFIGTILLIFFVLVFSRRSPKLHAALSGILLGLAIAAWVQSQILVWNFGPLDGRGIDWSRWHMHMWAEGLIWVLITAVVVAIFVWQSFSAARLLTIATIALGFFSLFTAVLTSSPPPPQSKNDPDVFRFHPQNNTIVIMLDTFQSDYFEKITNEFPDEVNFLNGFTFYRNTISSYPTTAPNMPAIFTGKTYKNEIPFKDYIEVAYSDGSLIDNFQDIGYESSIVSLPGVVQSATQMASYLTQGDRHKKISSGLFIDYGLFRSSPTVFKQRVYNQGNWLISFLAKGDYPPDLHGIVGSHANFPLIANLGQGNFPPLGHGNLPGGSG